MVAYIKRLAYPHGVVGRWRASGPLKALALVDNDNSTVRIDASSALCPSQVVMHQVTLQPSGHCFPVLEGKTILEAGLEAGLALPYSCRAAVCSSCRGLVKTGEVEHGAVFGTLSDSDKARGYALLCRAKPLSDVVVEVNEPRGLEGVRPRILPCRVVSVDQPISSVSILRVRLPNSEGLRFLAGQYVDFLLDGGVRRSFSIATKPSHENVTELDFHIRSVAGGRFTARVFESLKARDILRLEAPLGTFYLRQDSAKPIVMLASGTGFAPISAMCEAALEAGVFDQRPASIYWGGRTRADLYMLEKALGWRHPNLRFVPVLSEPTPYCSWTGQEGLVHRALMADFPDLSGHQVYACGSPAMVERARSDFLTKCGMQANDFFADSFLTELDRTPRASTPEKQTTLAEA